MLVAAIIATAAVPAPVRASCSPGRGTTGFGGFAGTQKTPAVTPDGVRVDTLEYSPYVNEGSEVTAWVMLVRLAGTPNLYAQVGWYRSKDSGVYDRSVFIQYTLSDGEKYTQHFPPATVGTYTTYKVDWSASTNTFRFFQEANVLRSAFLLWDPDTYEIYGETHQYGDQMPGGTGSHMVFDNTVYSVQGNSDWWGLGSPAGTNQDNWYGADRIDSSRYEVWDRACAS